MLRQPAPSPNANGAVLRPKRAIGPARGAWGSLSPRQICWLERTGCPSFDVYGQGKSRSPAGSGARTDGATTRRGRSDHQRACVVAPCFNDWKRFCFVLREIASGNNGCPLPGFEAQKRPQTVLVECGYTWPRRTVAPEPIAATDLSFEPENELKMAPRTSMRRTR
jgi:hypothetical protein